MSGAFVMAVVAGASGGGGSGNGPEAAPSGLSTYTYGGGLLLGLQWTNGDNSAYTEVSLNGGLHGTVDPGITSYNTGESALIGGDTWCVTHVKNGQSSSSDCVGT